jgi:hypothetical protein
MTDRKVPTPPKRSRFDGVGIVLAAVFEPPSGKGEKPGQTSKHRHRECVQSLDRMQLPHHHRKHRYAPLAATFFSGHDLATMKIGLQRAYSNCNADGLERSRRGALWRPCDARKSPESQPSE